MPSLTLYLHFVYRHDIAADTFMLWV